jgi:carboxyl-terminal processing protease
MRFLKAHGRSVVATVALAVAFVLSVQFSDRGVQFDLRNTSVSASESKEGEYDLASLKILNRVLLQIKDNYVEPERIDPNKMLVYALDEIQNSIAEVVVEFDKDRDEHPTKVEITVNQKAKTYSIGNIESLWEMSFRLREMFRFVQKHLDPETDVEYREVEYAAINGMLATLDPHSTLLPPEHYEEMQTQTGGKFGGLGIVISIRDGKLTVISPIDDTPASRAGIRARDHIVRIGEESTINMNLNEAVSMLRGEPGTPVELWIERKGWSEARKFKVERAVIKIDSVDSEPLANKVGYLRIKNFQANTFSDLKTHLGKLREKMGGMNGLVLDLRDNPGGLLDQAIKVSDLFLEEGTIVSTVGVGNRLREKREAKKGGTEGRYPILVLVNAGSASASEIVSGALQNHNRAVIVGDTTFGKGTVQVLYEFPDNSALKLTVAQYLTPGGISIQSKGITPDLRAVPVTVDSEDVDLFLSENILREQDLDSHLTSSAVRRDDGEGVQFIRFVREVEEEEDEFRDPDAFREDFEIRLAQGLLAEAGETWNRPDLLKALQPELEKVAEREFDTIKRDLRKLGVDWSRGPTQKKATLDVKVSTTPGNAPLEAGDELSITVTATNRGDETLHQLKAISESDHGVLDDREFLFGKLAPNQTKKWKVNVTIPKDAPSRHDVVKLRFSDVQHEFDVDGAELAVNVVGNERPQFGFSYDVQDESGDGVLNTGENVKLKVFVQNVGRADSAETLIYLKNLAHEAIYLKSGRARLDSVAKGESETVEFEFDVKQAPEDDEVKLEVDIYDTTFREYTEKKFSIPFATSGKKVKKAKGTAMVKGSPVKVFVAADTRANTAAVTAENAVLPVTGKVGDWLRVDVGERSGWVKSDLVDFTPGDRGALSGLARDVMFRPPAIKLEPSSFMTSSGNVKLEGAATDDSGVKDYYIFVYNRDDSKLNAKKLEYVRTGGSETIDITTDVPLFKGMNRIAVVARDDEGMSTTESTYVYRK